MGHGERAGLQLRNVKQKKSPRDGGSSRIGTSYLPVEMPLGAD